MNYTILLPIVGIFLIGYFTLYRNNLVFNYRMKIIDESLESYKYLPTYHIMVFDIFHWPSNKLKGKSKKPKKPLISGYQPEDVGYKGKPADPPKRP